MSLRIAASAALATVARAGTTPCRPLHAKKLLVSASRQRIAAYATQGGDKPSNDQGPTVTAPLSSVKEVEEGEGAKEVREGEEGDRRPIFRYHDHDRLYNRYTKELASRTKEGEPDSALPEYYQQAKEKMGVWTDFIRSDRVSEGAEREALENTVPGLGDELREKHRHRLINRRVSPERIEELAQRWQQWYKNAETIKQAKLAVEKEKLEEEKKEQEELKQKERLERIQAKKEANVKWGKKQVYLPNFTVTLLRNPKLPPNYAQFIVPLNLGKLDLRDYLYHAYNVRTLSVRSYVQHVPAVLEIRGERFQSPLKTRQLHRPRSIKKMTVQMEKPFVWPDEPKDMKPWDKEMYAKVEKYRKAQSESMLARKTKPDGERRSRVTKEAHQLLKDRAKEKGEKYEVDIDFLESQLRKEMAEEEKKVKKKEDEDKAKAEERKEKEKAIEAERKMKEEMDRKMTEEFDALEGRGKDETAQGTAAASPADEPEKAEQGEKQTTTEPPNAEKK